MRDRSRRILAAIGQRRHRERVAAFLTDPDDTKGHGLAGWSRFSKLVGGDFRSRKLFVRLYDAEPLLIELLNGDAAELNKVFNSRVDELQAALNRRVQKQIRNGNFNPNRQTAGLTTAAALVFLASDPRIPRTDDLASFVDGLIWREPLLRHVASEEGENKYRKLVLQFVLRGMGKELDARSFGAAVVLYMPETLPSAVRVLRTPAATSPRSLEYAAMIVGHFGSREHIPLVAPLLNNNAVCWEGQVREMHLECRVRDVALAVIIHLHGEDLGDYAFTSCDGLGSNVNWGPFLLGFPSEAARQKTIGLWNQYAARNRAAASGK